MQKRRSLNFRVVSPSSAQKHFLACWSMQTKSCLKNSTSAFPSVFFSLLSRWSFLHHSINIEWVDKKSRGNFVVGWWRFQTRLNFSLPNTHKLITVLCVRFNICLLNFCTGRISRDFWLKRTQLENSKNTSFAVKILAR